MARPVPFEEMESVNGDESFDDSTPYAQLLSDYVTGKVPVEDIVEWIDSAWTTPEHESTTRYTSFTCTPLEFLYGFLDSIQTHAQSFMYPEPTPTPASTSTSTTHTTTTLKSNSQCADSTSFQGSLQSEEMFPALVSQRDVGKRISTTSHSNSQTTKPKRRIRTTLVSKVSTEDFPTQFGANFAPPPPIGVWGDERKISTAHSEKDPSSNVSEMDRCMVPNRNVRRIHETEPLTGLQAQICEEKYSREKQRMTFNLESRECKQVEDAKEEREQEFCAPRTPPRVTKTVAKRPKKKAKSPVDTSRDVSFVEHQDNVHSTVCSEAVLCRVASLHAVVLRKRYIPCLSDEIHFLVRMLCVNEELKARDERNDVENVFWFRSGVDCWMYASKVLSEMEPIVRCFGPKLIALLQKAVLSRINNVCDGIPRAKEPLSRFGAQLRTIHEAMDNEKRFLRGIRNVHIDGNGVHRSLSAIFAEFSLSGCASNNFALPFRQDVDSRNHFKTAEGSRMYINREKTRDEFLAKVRLFQKRKHELQQRHHSHVVVAVHHNNNGLKSTTGPLELEKVFRNVLLENHSWFASFFVALLLQIGIAPLEETDEEVLAHKHFGKDLDKLRKLHRRFSSKRSSTNPTSAVSGTANNTNNVNDNATLQRNVIVNDDKKTCVSSGGVGPGCNPGGSHQPGSRPGVTPNNVGHRRARTWSNASSSSTSTCTARISRLERVSSSWSERPVETRFTGHQEFFYMFLMEVDSFRFHSLVKELLMSKILELTAVYETSSAPHNTSNSNVEQNVDQSSSSGGKSFKIHLLQLRVLGKFLGLLLFSPHYTSFNSMESRTSDHQNVAITTERADAVRVYESLPHPFDVLELVQRSVKHANLSLSLVWVQEYTFFLLKDPVARCAKSTHVLFTYLYQLYRARWVDVEHNYYDDQKHFSLLMNDLFILFHLEKLLRVGLEMDLMACPPDFSVQHVREMASEIDLVLSQTRKKKFFKREQQETNVEKENCSQRPLDMHPFLLLLLVDQPLNDDIQHGERVFSFLEDTFSFLRSVQTNDFQSKTPQSSSSTHPSLHSRRKQLRPISVRGSDVIRPGLLSTVPTRTGTNHRFQSLLQNEFFKKYPSLKENVQYALGHIVPNVVKNVVNDVFEPVLLREVETLVADYCQTRTLAAPSTMMISEVEGRLWDQVRAQQCREKCIERAKEAVNHRLERVVNLLNDPTIPSQVLHIACQIAAEHASLHVSDGLTENMALAVKRAMKTFVKHAKQVEKYSTKSRVLTTNHDAELSRRLCEDFDRVLYDESDRCDHGESLESNLSDAKDVVDLCESLREFCDVVRQRVTSTTTSTSTSTVLPLSVSYFTNRWVETILTRICTLLDEAVQQRLWRDIPTRHNALMTCIGHVQMLLVMLQINDTKHVQLCRKIVLPKLLNGPLQACTDLVEKAIADKKTQNTVLSELNDLVELVAVIVVHGVQNEYLSPEQIKHKFSSKGTKQPQFRTLCSGLFIVSVLLVARMVQKFSTTRIYSVKPMVFLWYARMKREINIEHKNLASQHTYGANSIISLLSESMLTIERYVEPLNKL